MNYFFSNTKHAEMSLDERYYKLKYFYLIDVDSIINKLEQSNIINDTGFTNSETLLHTIFDAIFTASKPYNIFLSPHDAKLSNSFFGEMTLKPESGMKEQYELNYTSAMKELMYIALRNHCIIHGIFYTISNTNEWKEKIEITAKNNHLYNNEAASKDSTLYQRYTNRYSKHYTQENATRYSHQILENISSNGTLDNNSYSYSNDSVIKYKTPHYLSTFAFHLFNEPIYNIFDKHILKINDNSNNSSFRFISLYTDLSHAFIDYLNNYGNSKTKLDQLFFCFPMEYFYGFSSFRYIAQALEDIHNSSALQKDLEGSLLLKVIKQLSMLPNVYSRHFFLKYATEAVTSTENSQFFLENDPNIALSFKPHITTEDFIRTYGFSRLTNFFKSLATINLPILEDLWVVVLHKLLKAKNYESPMGFYSEYINKNYDLLTADFTRLSSETIYSLYNDTDGKIDQQKLRKSLDNTSVISNDYYLKFSPSTRRDLQNIMLHHFNINHHQPTLPPINILTNINNTDTATINLDTFIYEHKKTLYTYFWKQKL